MAVRKVVIPAAGMGTRLLSVTKEMPKEMLPIFAKASNGSVCLKPMVQIVFEQLYDEGFREFCFIVGRGKRAIEDHFSPDRRYLDQLRAGGRPEATRSLEDFYGKIESSTIVWANQPEPRGFGHAILQAKPFTNREPFIVHAGDTYIQSGSEGHVQRMLRLYESERADAALCLVRIDDPRQYGVAEVEGDVPPYRVCRLVEKPEEPLSNLAVVPLYLFTERIFRALEETPPGRGGELQLTDGIQRLIEDGCRVVAFELEGGLHLDIGTPQTYWEAQRKSYLQAKGDLQKP